MVVLIQCQYAKYSKQLKVKYNLRLLSADEIAFKAAELIQ